jgi:hypothetical protein
MTNSIIVMALSTLSLFFIISYSILLKKFIGAKNIMAKLVFDNFTLEKLIELKNDQDIKTDESVHKENFLKFISESRDWAFDYIENVQNVIKNILEQTESTIEYHNNFKSMEIEPYSTQIEILTKAIEELKILLPNKEFLK